MSQTPGVLHLRASNFVGGPERQVLRYAEFDRHGPIQVTLASYVGSEEGKEFLETAQRRGIATLPLPAGSVGAFKSVSMLAQYIREQGISLVCTHGYRADILGISAARRCRVPVACFLRGWTKEDWKVRTYEALDRAVLRRATRIVALSETQASHLRRQGAIAGRVHVVGNAIDVRHLDDGERRGVRSELHRRLRFAEDAFIVATSGRLSPEKGAAFFIQAIPAIREQFPGARFVLFGEGPLRKELEGLARRCGLGDEIRFAGFVPDFPRLLSGVNVLVNPSLSEQMPNVVLEAMAAGVPVVATAVGGVPEMCGDGSLLLLPPGDARAIQEVVISLLSDPARARSVALAGQRRAAEAYSPARQKAQLHALYEEFIPSVKASTLPHLRPASAPATPEDRHDSGNLPFVSVVIPVRNEGAHLGSVLDELVGQDYPRDRYEILVVDGGSTDGTCSVIARYVRNFPKVVNLLHNPERLSSAGRNVGVRASRGDIVIFIDGHCRIKNTRLLIETARTLERTGADCLCRPQPLTLTDNTLLQNIIAHVRATALGHGRDSTIYAMSIEGFVDPTSSGATYRRSVFDRVGYYDERFDACEDVEFNYRVFKGGLLSYLSPALAVYYRPRSGLLGLFRQLVRYGRGRWRFVTKHHDAASVSQLVPPVFLAWLVGGGLASIYSSTVRGVLVATLVLYATVVLGFSIWLGFRHGWRHFFIAPAVYPAIHLGLGAGFWLQLGTSVSGSLHGNKKQNSMMPAQPSTPSISNARLRGETPEVEKSRLHGAGKGR